MHIVWTGDQVHVNGQFFTGITRIFCDLLESNGSKCLEILYSWIFIRNFPPRLYLPYRKWIFSPYKSKYCCTIVKETK